MILYHGIPGLGLTVAGFIPSEITKIGLPQAEHYRDLEEDRRVGDVLSI